MKYINPQYSLPEFLGLLHAASVKYVILRWFINPEELLNQVDIDFLVADEDLLTVQTLLVKDGVGGKIKVDIYSISGIYGSSFRKIPYYPSYLAKKILDSRQFHKYFYFVPATHLYFFSFLFHLVFHKAEKTGIPVDQYDTIKISSDNKYVSELSRLSEITRIILPYLITLDSLFILLKQNDWIPPIEWIRKVGHNKSPWLMSLYPKIPKKPAIAVFIIREKANKFFIQDHLLTLFQNNKILVVYHSILTEEEKRRAMTYLRGGKWDHGPNIIGGGDPYEVYLLVDFSPEEVPVNISRDYPYLTNIRFLELKFKARQLIEDLLECTDSINCIHSSDDDLEAREFIKILFPGDSESNGILERVPVASNETPYNLINSIHGKNKRTILSVIDWNGKKAIRKTFHKEFSKYFRRELFAYSRLGSDFRYIPKLLSSGENELIIEYINFDIADQSHLLRNRLNDVANIIRDLWLQGFAHLDLHPGNFIIDKTGNIFLIDYEFFYEYETRPDSVFSSYDIKGHFDHVAWGIKGKNPAGYIDQLWIELTGIGLIDILKTGLPLSV